MSPSASDQRGFLLVEIMVAALILVIGLLGVFLALDSSSHSASTARRQEIALDQAEQAMEYMKSLSYANLALSSAPAHANDTSTGAVPSTPNYWVNTAGTKLLIPTDFNVKTSGTLSGVASTGESFVTATGGVAPQTRCASGQTCSAVDGVSFTIYRYVTQEDECSGLLTLCGIPINSPLLTQYAKRITVAVVLDAGPAGVGQNKPVWLTTVVANPGASVVSVG